MSSSLARKTLRHGTRTARATRPIPSLLTLLVARTQQPDAFAHAWSDYVDTHVDPEELNHCEPADPLDAQL